MRAGFLGVHLGNAFLTKKGGRALDLACQTRARQGLYDRIEIVFAGIGIADAGETPEMSIEAPCLSRSDAGSLDVIWIPIEQLLAEKPGDRELKIDGETPLTVKFEHIPDQWPENWVLTRVKVFRFDNPDQAIYLDEAHMLEVRGDLLSFALSDREEVRSPTSVE